MDIRLCRSGRISLQVYPTIFPSASAPGRRRGSGAGYLRFMRSGLNSMSDRVAARIVFALIWPVFAGGCAIRCNEATFHRYEAVAPFEGVRATALMGGGVRLENDAGLFMDLASCWPGRQKDADICLEIYLSKGHRFQFLETEFTALGLNGNASTSLKLAPMTYRTHCSVDYSSKSLFAKAPEPPTPEAACPAESSLVRGPMQVEETDRSMPGRFILIVRKYEFDPSLEFEGDNVKAFSVHKEVQWQSYNTIVMRGLRLGMDLILVPPRIAIDGKEVSLPRLRIKTVQDKLCHVQELM